MPRSVSFASHTASSLSVSGLLGACLTSRARPSSPAQHRIKDLLLRQVLPAFTTYFGTHMFPVPYYDDDFFVPEPCRANARG